MTAESQANTEKGSSVGFDREDIPGALPTHFPRAFKIGFWFCITIAVAVVLRRVVALSTPPDSNAPPQLASLDAYFASHATLTYIHILCSLAFVSLLPLLFWRRTRGSAIIEQAFFLLGVLVGGTAYSMSIHAVGGTLERSAVLFFNTLFLASLGFALLNKRRGNQEQKQRWMLRAIAIVLGIATTRPVMGVFFATSHFTWLTPQQFFGIAFWIGFTLNTLVMELWLHNRSLSAERTRL
jgi:hypothetical protein